MYLTLIILFIIYYLFSKRISMKKSMSFKIWAVVGVIAFFIGISVISTHSIDSQHHRVHCEDLFIQYQSLIANQNPTLSAEATTALLMSCPEYKNRVA